MDSDRIDYSLGTLSKSEWTERERRRTFASLSSALHSKKLRLPLDQLIALSMSDQAQDLPTELSSTSLSSPSSPTSPLTSHHTPARQTVIRVRPAKRLLIPPPNFGTVESNLYRSGQPNELSFPFLEELSLKTLIWLAPEDPNESL